ncbi:MAG: SRPBCC family protein [Gaiellaceae bacterium]
MAPLVHSVEIDRSREDVFAYVTDPTRFPEWQDALVRASHEGSGPLQQSPGSR